MKDGDSNLRQWNCDDDVDELQAVVLQFVVNIHITATVFIFSGPTINWEKRRENMNQDLKSHQHRLLPTISLEVYLVYTVTKRLASGSVRQSGGGWNNWKCKLLLSGIRFSSWVWNRHFSTPTSVFNGNGLEAFFRAICCFVRNNSLSTFGCVWIWMPRLSLFSTWI